MEADRQGNSREVSRLLYQMPDPTERATDPNDEPQAAAAAAGAPASSSGQMQAAPSAAPAPAPAPVMQVDPQGAERLRDIRRGTLLEQPPPSPALTQGAAIIPGVPVDPSPVDLRAMNTSDELLTEPITAVGQLDIPLRDFDSMVEDARRERISLSEAEAIRTGHYAYNPRHDVMVAPTNGHVYLVRPPTGPERAAIAASNVGAAAQGPIQRLREGASRFMQSISPSRQRPPAQEMREISRPAGLPDPINRSFSPHQVMATAEVRPRQ